MANTYRRNKRTRKRERDGYNPAISRSCEHNGGCPWCERNRLHSAIKSNEHTRDDIDAYYLGEQWDYLDQYELEVSLAFDLDYEDLLRRDMDLESPETVWENYKRGIYGRD